MRGSGTWPTSLIAQHPANANFKSYLLQRAHKLLLPGNKTMFYKFSEGLPYREYPKEWNLQFTILTTTRPVHCLHPTAPQSPFPSLNFLKAFTIDLLHCFLIYVSIFIPPLYYIWFTKAGLCVCLVHWYIHRTKTHAWHIVFTEHILVELFNLNSRHYGFRKHMGILMTSIRFQNSVTLSLYQIQRFQFCSHFYTMKK